MAEFYVDSAISLESEEEMEKRHENERIELESKIKLMLKQAGGSKKRAEIEAQVRI